MGVTQVESDLDLISHLDFAYAPPCEVKWHEQIGHTMQAHYIVDAICTNCGDSIRLLICEECYAVAMKAHMWCEECNHNGPAREFWKVVGLV